MADWPEVDAETVARRREMMEAAAARTGAIMANLRLAAAVADALAGPDVEAVNVTAPCALLRGAALYPPACALEWF